MCGKLPFELAWTFENFPAFRSSYFLMYDIPFKKERVWDTILETRKIKSL